MTLAQQLRQEGRMEGILKSLQTSILDVLESRFERVPEGLREAVETIVDESRLKQLLRAAARCADLESFAREL